MVLLWFLFLGISGLFKAAVDIRGNSPFLERLFEFLDIPNGMYQGSLTTEKRSDRKYDIEFRDVSFRYPGTENWALRHLSVKFEIGKKLAVVGPNGSGKTTFIKLLCRLYDPTEGVILLDGKDIREYDTHELYNIFGIIFQDFGKYAVSVSENISFGNIDAEPDPERIRESARQSSADEYIRALPRDYDTPLMRIFEQDGIELSGGEAQKLMMARALYKDAPVLVLDEPTAALDPIAENEIYLHYRDMTAGKTSLFISHRLASTQFCDRVLFLSGGKITEEGTHDELIASGGEYSKLYEIQSCWYRDDYKGGEQQ